MRFFKKRGDAHNSIDRLAASRGAAGKRCYAIGDVHGCYDQLVQLFEEIDRDIQKRPSKPTFIIMLGDVIDRGPDSRKVIETLMSFSSDYADLKCVSGNHEAALLEGLRRNRSFLSKWIAHGGLQCAISYGVLPGELLEKSDAEIENVLLQTIPELHLRFLESFKDSVKFGDYLMVHAGLKPGVPIEQQSRDDLHWIREEFLEAEYDHGLVVVHGHSIVPRVKPTLTRIAIDTGAYQGGDLTALGIEDDKLWSIGVAPNRKITTIADLRTCEGG